MPDGPRAALDCGSNSTRLFVADEAGRSLTRLMRITRLGQGVDSTHRLDPEAMDRTLAVLVDYRKTMDDLGVVRGRMVATSAVRDAENGDYFLVSASGAVGLPAELLSGEEEGYLAFLGATANLPAASGADVVVDIGGGSTEITVGRDNRISTVSLQIGCVRLTERSLHHDPPTQDEVATARAVIHLELDRAAHAIPQLQSLPPGSRLIGLAGTVSTLSALNQGLREYDWDRLHHSTLTRQAVEYWCELLGSEAATVRARRPGMTLGREDVILGGAMILAEVMDRFGFEDCLVSEQDILDGLVATLSKVSKDA